MTSSVDRIREYYEQNAATERDRLATNSLEFRVTCCFLDDFIPPAAAVLDVGAGPGRYSIYLAKQGHAVTLLDLSSECVRLALEEAEQSSIRFERTIVADARDMTGIESGTFDAVLCLGPVYHLHEKSDRERVIEECLRVLKPDGVFFCGFISKYAPVSDLAKSNPEEIVHRVEALREFIETGTRGPHRGWTYAHYIDPLQVSDVMSAFPLTEVAVAGVEGMIPQSEERIREHGEAILMRWANFMYEISHEKSVMASGSGGRGLIHRILGLTLMRKSAGMELAQESNRYLTPEAFGSESAVTRYSGARDIARPFRAANACALMQAHL